MKTSSTCKHQGLVVLRIDKAIHWIHRQPIDSPNNWGQWNSVLIAVFYKRTTRRNMRRRSKVLLRNVVCDLIISDMFPMLMLTRKKRYYVSPL